MHKRRKFGTPLIYERMLRESVHPKRHFYRPYMVDAGKKTQDKKRMEREYKEGTNRLQRGYRDGTVTYRMRTRCVPNEKEKISKRYRENIERRRIVCKISHSVY